MAVLAAIAGSALLAMTLAGTKTVIAYPHVLDGATVCYLWVNTTAPRPAARTAAAEFAD